MRNLMVWLFALLFSSAPLHAEDAAAPAPSELRGKSIIILWSEQRMQRHVGEPDFYSVKASHDLRVYVSGEGRVFTRLTNTTGSGTGKGEQVSSGGPPPTHPALVPEYGDKSMTLFMPFTKGGRRRATIEFEAGYGKCSARVVHAREEGATEILAWSPITKKYVEFQSAKTFNEVCVIRDGNVFAEP